MILILIFTKRNILLLNKYDDDLIVNDYKDFNEIILDNIEFGNFTEYLPVSKYLTINFVILSFLRRTNQII